jgi:aryl-alcohol dehydrogenase-like predicted oxidoreductase
MSSTDTRLSDGRDVGGHQLLDLESTLARTVRLQFVARVEEERLRYRTLGGTGIEVSVQCLGTMMFGQIGNPDHDECIRMVDMALERGINFIDTADMYSAGESEEIVGKALRGRRDDIVLATKVHFQMGEGRNRSGSSRRWIVRACEESLRRLQTDWIDLYQIHRPDPSTDIEETLSALTELVHQGKIRAFGCSTFPASQIVEAYYVAERRGLGRFRAEQPPYSLLTRGIEAAVLPTCERFRMGVLTWSPLAWGFLSGRYRKGSPVDLGTGRPTIDATRFDPANPETAVKLEIVEQLVEVASGVDLTLPELALAFPASHPAVTSVIIGPRTPDQLESALAAASVALDDAVLDRIDAIVPPGTNAYRNEGAWIPPSLSEPLLRRRPVSDRAAA